MIHHRGTEDTEMQNRMERKYDRLADEITEELFTDGGNGKKASRLMLMHRDSPFGPERPGCGWCKAAVHDVILKHLRSL